MKYGNAIVFFLFATFGLAVGLLGTRLYGAGIGRTSTKNPIPAWFGRLWFVGFATWALYRGIEELVKLRR